MDHIPNVGLPFAILVYVIRIGIGIYGLLSVEKKGHIVLLCIFFSVAGIVLLTITMDANAAMSGGS